GPQGVRGQACDPRHQARGPGRRRTRARRAGEQATQGERRASRGARLGDHGALPRRCRAGGDGGHERARGGRPRRRSGRTAATAGAETKHRGGTGSIAATGVWTGQEEQNFQPVIDGFTKANTDVKVKYTSSGDQTPTVLSTAVAGGNPPDLAAVSQPGLMKDFASRGALKPIDFAKGVIAKNYTPSWSTLGSVKGHLYGPFFKGANKSTVLY